MTEITDLRSTDKAESTAGSLIHTASAFPQARESPGDFTARTTTLTFPVSMKAVLQSPSGPFLQYQVPRPGFTFINKGTVEG